MKNTRDSLRAVDLPRLVRPFDVPDAAEHERLLTEDTEDLDEYPDCGLPRHTRLRLLKGIILPTTVAMVEFIEYARPNNQNQAPNQSTPNPASAP